MSWAASLVPPRYAPRAYSGLWPTDVAQHFHVSVEAASYRLEADRHNHPLPRDTLGRAEYLMGISSLQQTPDK